MPSLHTAAIFSDHMVIQKGKPFEIWGHDYTGRTVTVTFNVTSASAECRKNEWRVTLPPPAEYGGPYELSVTDGLETLTYTDIYVGEVWIAGGQSNMEFELQNEKNGADALEALCPDVRFYYTKKNAYMDEFFYLDEQNGGWALPDREGSRCWSAVGYYFGKQLAEKLGVKVGIIGCNWGGTSASNWVPREDLAADSDLRSYNDEYDRAMEGKTFEEYCHDLDEYNDYVAKWQPKINEFYAANPHGTWEEAQAYAGESRYPEPLGPKSPFRAGGLYQCMIRRIAPYSARGFIYYQGESDDHKPHMYEKLLKVLIARWRKDWHDPEMPFLLVQLPMHKWSADEDTKSWCFIRNAQMNTALTTANTYIAAALDCGEFDNIHPVEKGVVAHRLALQALCHVYGLIPASQADAPRYARSFPAGSSLVVELSDPSVQLSSTEGGTVSGFEIWGADGEPHPAAADISAPGKIVLTCPEVSRPTGARYCWTNYAPVTVFGDNGLPLVPFNTAE